MNTFKVKLLDNNAKLPTRTFPTDVGMDIYSLDSAIVEPGEGYTFSTGIAGEFEPGYVGMFSDRSSMAKKGFKLAGGIIDPGYTGELKVVLRNLSRVPLTVNSGDRIAQLLIIPVIIPTIEQVDNLKKSDRSSSGFGSSGR